jgi:hypothetical protein
MNRPSPLEKDQHSTTSPPDQVLKISDGTGWRIMNYLHQWPGEKLETVLRPPERVKLKS